MDQIGASTFDSSVKEFHKFEADMTKKLSKIDQDYYHLTSVYNHAFGIVLLLKTPIESNDMKTKMKVKIEIYSKAKTYKPISPSYLLHSIPNERNLFGR